jgi:hypothetical protein
VEQRIELVYQGSCNLRSTITASKASAIVPYDHALTIWALGARMV